MIEFESKLPLDIDKAIKSITNQNKKVFYEILKKFINETLWRSIKDIGLAIDKENFKRFKLNAHNLKSAAGYTGAVYIHYDCYFIQKAYVDKKYDDMTKKYN